MPKGFVFPYPLDRNWFDLKPKGRKWARLRYVYRSAVTGKFVTAAYARRYPKRTIRQRLK
ncbi:MAG: hypothetical protein ACRDHG_13905 [Anaerolineales bacterium]